MLLRLDHGFFDQRCQSPHVMLEDGVVENVKSGEVGETRAIESRILMVHRGKPIDSEILVNSGLAAMKRTGKPLAPLRREARATIYVMPNGETVRMRTCNDRKVVVVSWTDALDAKLNIEGTDWVLLVMPEVRRKLGKTICYLVPTNVLAAEARCVREAWLARKPDRVRNNRTWKLWFGQKKGGNASDLETMWSQYRLDISIIAAQRTVSAPSSRGIVVKKEIDEARRRIALAAGVPIKTVRIKISFEQ